MKESIKHGRKKHPQKHRRYGEKRERDEKRYEDIREGYFDTER